MVKLLRTLVILLAVVVAAAFLWEQRGRLVGLKNNNIRIQGTWYQVEMNRKGFTPYRFSERIITKDGVEWGSYKIRRNTELEVLIGTKVTVFELSFPDDQNMVWSVEIDGKMTPAMRWRE